MKIAIIGASGVVGTVLTEHFEYLGHEVLPVNRNSQLTLEEAAQRAEVVFVVTLPIEAVSELINRAATRMKSGSLLVHGTSIEYPKEPYQITAQKALTRGLTFGHCHFHFRPEAPLWQTLAGQNISLHLEGPAQTDWQVWLEQQLKPYGPIIHQLKANEHDQITSLSQLTHMVIAFLIASSWQENTKPLIQKSLSIGGPPYQLLIRSLLRTTLNSRVVGSILVNHPKAEQLLDTLEHSLVKLRQLIAERKAEKITQTLEDARSVFEPDQLVERETTTTQLTHRKTGRE